jgi:hypothetical protein
MLLDIDPLSKVLETMRYDRETESLVINYEQKVDHILDYNVAAQNDCGQAWRGDDNDFWHVGSVPEYMLYNWLMEFNQGKPADERVQSPYEGDERWNRYIMDKLNLGEFRKLKTAPVRL